MASRPSSVRGRGRLRSAVLLLFLMVTGTRAQAPGAEEVLPLGESRERPIAAGEAHAWRVDVPPETSLLVTVEQRSVDLVTEDHGPGGGEPIASDAPNGRWGMEVLVLDAPGEHRVEVRPASRSAWPGSYAIRSEALPAPPAASAKRDALALMSRAGSTEAAGQAAALYRQALAAWRSLGETFWEAETRICLGRLEQEANELPQATEDLQAALELWRRLAEPHRQADALNLLGAVYLDTRDTDQTREALEGARALWHSLEERFEEAETRGTLCLLDHRRGGPLDQVLACYQENLSLFHESGLKAQEARTLNSIGGVHELQGESDLALELYEQARTMLHDLADRTGEVQAMINIAKMHRVLGEWQEALRIYASARDVAAPLANPGLETYLLNNTGYTYLSLGEPDRALPYFEEVLELWRKAGNRALEITALNNAGAAWRKLGDTAKALDRHRQALALATAQQDRGQQAVSRLRLAEALLDLGDGSAALRELDAALPLVQQTGNRGTETEILQQRGRALVLASRAQEALPVLQEVLTRRRAARDRSGEAETLYALASAERSLGLAAEARSHAEAAVERIEELRTRFATPDLRASFLATRRLAFSLLVDLLMERHAAEPGKGHDREAFAWSEKARARSLLDALRVESAGRTANVIPPELLARRRSLLGRLNDKVDQRWKQSGEKAAAVERDIDTLLAALDGIAAEIRRRDPQLAAFSAGPPASPQEISGWLEPGTLLLEYSLGEKRSYLWAVEAGRLRSFVLPGQSQIETLARRLYGQLSTVEAGGSHDDAAAASLGRILLEPIWSEAPRFHRLVVVPDGALGLIPFAALPVPTPGQGWQAAGTRKPLLESLEVVAIPSATTYAAQRQLLRRRIPAPRLAAILADPVFSRDDPRLAHLAAKPSPSAQSGLRGAAGDGLGDYERLPSTRREAEAVAALAPAGQVWTGLGLEASRDAVLSGALRDFRVLHFATHAVADTRSPELSGLVLSQVDAQGHPRAGFLGLSDIYELDLGADLVVLSGCQTALGKEVRGEGLMGLTRGFQYAGVPRVVASLWRVQDRATAELMTRFYRALWRDHLPAAAALREAQRALRREPRYRDPYSWAGFVLQGDWH